MKSKYLIVEDRGCELPIIFNPILNHRDIAGNFKVISAGFCSRDIEGVFTVWGNSVALGVKHRKEDEMILMDSLEFYCI